MESRLTTSPISNANASKLLGVQHKRVDKTQQQVPLSAKLQITSVGKDPLAFESTFVKLSKHLGKSPEGRGPLTHAPVFYSWRFSCAAELWICSLFPFFLSALESAVFALELTLDVLEITKSSPPASMKP